MCFTTKYNHTKIIFIIIASNNDKKLVGFSRIFSVKKKRRQLQNKSTRNYNFLLENLYYYFTILYSVVLYCESKF